VDGRDPERAPIPWRPPSEAGPGAGFTTGEPWLPLAADAERLNVERQAADPRSTLSLVRRLADLRARTPALQSGAQQTLEAGDDVLAFVREAGEDRLLAAVNFATRPVALRLATALPRQASLLVSSDPDREEGAVDPAGLVLAPAESVLLRV
jgi:alpha-glucosidase